MTPFAASARAFGVAAVLSLLGLVLVRTAGRRYERPLSCLPAVTS